MLNLELIKSLTENGETVLNYIENPKSHEVLNGVAIDGERAMKALEGLEKYIAKNGAKSSVSMVAFKLDKIAKYNGAARKKRANAEVPNLSSEEYKQWQCDMNESDENFNKAGVKCMAAERGISGEVVVVSAESMHVVDAEEMLIFMDENAINVARCEGYEYSRSECYKALGI